MKEEDEAVLRLIMFQERRVWDSIGSVCLAHQKRPPRRMARGSLERELSTCKQGKSDYNFL